MLIDSNAYIGHWPFRQYKDNTVGALLAKIQEYSVDMAVVSSLNGIFYKNTQHANEELIAEINSKRAFRNRFIPFGVINPVYGGWRDDFKVCTAKMGMKGIRIYPEYHRYDLLEPACVELVKMCRDKGIPVALSLRMTDRRVSSWMDVEKEWALKDVMPIIKAVPDARYMIVNVANNTSLNEEELALFKKADILIDTSGRNITDMVSLFQRFGMDKFCFGTHSPLLDYFTGLLRIESLRDSEADAKTKDLLRSGNLKRLLAL